MQRYALRLVAAFVVLLLGTVVVRLAADEAAPAKTEEKTTEELASGLDIGQTLPAFNPTHVTGPDKGTNTCPV